MLHMMIMRMKYSADRLIVLLIIKYIKMVQVYDVITREYTYDEYDNML